jgi:Trk K+ transport system NAD-binding subunit
VAIARGDQLIFPEPNTLIRSGDVLSVLVPDAALSRLHAILGDTSGNPDDRSDDEPDEPTMI